MLRLIIHASLDTLRGRFCTNRPPKESPKCVRSISWVLNRAQIEYSDGSGSAQAHHVQCIDTMAGSSASNILLPVQDRAINAMQQG